MRARWALVAVAAMIAGPLSACAAESEPPTAVFLGDALTAGSSLPAEQGSDDWATLVSQQFGWRDVYAGCEGSSYTIAGADCAATLRQSVEFVVDEDPEVIVVSGGVEDLGATVGEIEAAVYATFATLRETFPQARIYAVGALPTDTAAVDALAAADVAKAGGQAAPDLATLNGIVAQQAAKVDAIYVDLGDPLDDRPGLLATDGTPTADGHAVIAELTSNVIGETQ
ncbi:SGNH/GDSL hydrolase family protein [Demequina sp.]|uniref:SGNH/GDSL hydrolase family protein n=1 Tax=Demequina sp. TaxID=2050685 RepID=UPI003A860D7F